MDPPAIQTVLESTSSTASNTSSTNMLPQKSRLLSLPPELLNYIVTLAVVKKGSKQRRVKADIQKRRVDDRREFLATPTSPGLACTCVLLRALVLPIYYGQNLFWFATPARAVDWFSLKLARKDDAIARNIIVKVEGIATMDISLKDHTNELAVRFDRLDEYLSIERYPQPKKRES